MVNKIENVDTIVFEYDDGMRGTVSGVKTTEEMEAAIGRPLPSDPVWENQQAARVEGAALYSGLGQLTARDMLYAAKGRSMAIEFGATQPEIAAIVNRATAAAYITGTDFWANMTATERQRWADDVDSWVRVLTPMVGIIRDLT